MRGGSNHLNARKELCLLDTIALRSNNSHSRLSQTGFVFYLNIFHAVSSIVGVKAFFLYSSGTSRVRDTCKTAVRRGIT